MDIQKRVARRTFRYTFLRNAHPDQQIGEVEIPKRTGDEFQRSSLRCCSSNFQMYGTHIERSGKLQILNVQVVL